MCGSDSGGSSGDSGSASGPGYGASTSGDGYGSDAGYGQGSDQGTPGYTGPTNPGLGSDFGSMTGAGAESEGAFAAGGGNSLWDNAKNFLARMGINLGIGSLTAGIGGPAGYVTRAALGFLGNQAMNGAFGPEAATGTNATSPDGGKAAPSALSSVGEMLRGGMGLYEAQRLRQLGAPSPVNSMADARLQQLLANPASASQLPGYQLGLDAVQRRMAAGGFNGSGNMATGLMDYGGNFYNQALQQYSGLSRLGTENQATYNLGAAALGGQAINSLGYGAIKLFGK